MNKHPKDFLRACKKAGRDPKEIRDSEVYMRVYVKVGEKLKNVKA